jgi:hypothetical protein
MKHRFVGAAAGVTVAVLSGCAADDGERVQAMAAAMSWQGDGELSIALDGGKDETTFLLSGRGSALGPHRKSILALRTVTSPSEKLTWPSSLGRVKVFEVVPRMVCRAQGCAKCPSGTCAGALPAPLAARTPDGDAGMVLPGAADGRHYLVMRSAGPGESLPIAGGDGLGMTTFSGRRTVHPEGSFESMGVATLEPAGFCVGARCVECLRGACNPTQQPREVGFSESMDLNSVSCRLEGSCWFQFDPAGTCPCPVHGAVHPAGSTCPLAATCG